MFAQHLADMFYIAPFAFEIVSNGTPQSGVIDIMR